MRRTDLPKRFQKLLADIPYTTIATTCPDGTPWNSPIVSYFDDDLNLYWASWTRNQHSLNIAGNPNIFAVVFDSSAPLGQGEALYFQMKTRKLENPDDIEAAKKIYLDRYGEDTCRHPFAGTCPRRVYRAEPIKVWSNIDGARGAHFVDVRVPMAAQA